MRGETFISRKGDIKNMKFQSTLPMRGETYVLKDVDPEVIISIHSPHAGRDSKVHLTDKRQKDFNPLSPCGERRNQPNLYSGSPQFQSTLPMRGETQDFGKMGKMKNISIHSPHAGRDYGFADIRYAT